MLLLVLSLHLLLSSLLRARLLVVCYVLLLSCQATDLWLLPPAGQADRAASPCCCRAGGGG